MAYVTVDVDMSEFDTHELIDELTYRIRRKGRKKPTELQMEAIASSIREYLEEIGESPTGLPIKTLDDKIKIEIVQRVWGDMTVAELEKRLA